MVTFFPTMQTRTKRFLLLMLIFLVLAACNFPLSTLPGGIVVRPTLPDLERRMDQDQWASWIRRLSGEEPVLIGGEPALIQTRYNYAMFTGQPNARAFEYLGEQVLQFVRPDQVEVHDYTYTDAERAYTWKNLVVTLPGRTRPQEVVMFTAHFDSTVVRDGNALQAAPGANDNGTGVATLLEGVRLLSAYPFERTIRFVFFSGEENGLAGSRAYVAEHDLSNVVGVLNLDMFGHDSTGDRCFELHVGTLPQSDEMGRAFLSTLVQYNFNLTYDYLVEGATNRSDHTPFWEDGIGAVTVIENFFDDNLASGCQGVDPNPNYHRPTDTLDKINIDYAFAIARAAILTVAQAAAPLSPLW
jgi:leucyl aminopeptidase